MKLLGLPTTKHFFSFILGYPQAFNFARLFWYGWVETGLNGQNSRAKLKSYGHPRIKLKKSLWLGDLKSSLRIAAKKNRFKKRHLMHIVSKDVDLKIVVFFIENLTSPWTRQGHNKY